MSRVVVGHVVLLSFGVLPFYCLLAPPPSGLRARRESFTIVEAKHHEKKLLRSIATNVTLVALTPPLERRPTASQATSNCFSSLLVSYLASSVRLATATAH